MKKDKIVFALLAIFLGTLGIQHFYVNNTKKGVIYLLCGTIGWLLFAIPPLIISIICIYEFITHLLMSDEEFNAKYHLNA